MRSAFSSRLAVATHRVEDTERLKAAGADLILYPYFDAATQAIHLLEQEERRPVRQYEVEEQREF